MQIHQGVSVELRTVDVFNQQLNRRSMVQDHLRFDRSLSASGLPVLNQLARVQPRISIAFQVARCPRQVNQQAIENGSALQSTAALFA